jgi:hypothetical protein
VGEWLHQPLNLGFWWRRKPPLHQSCLKTTESGSGEKPSTLPSLHAAVYRMQSGFRLGYLSNWMRGELGTRRTLPGFLEAQPVERQLINTSSGWWAFDLAGPRSWECEEFGATAKLDCVTALSRARHGWSHESTAARPEARLETLLSELGPTPPHNKAEIALPSTPEPPTPCTELNSKAKERSGVPCSFSSFDSPQVEAPRRSPTSEDHSVTHA